MRPVTSSRILVIVLLIVSILYLNWWITALFAMSGIFMFRNFYEAVGAGVLLDVLYSTADTTVFGLSFFFSLLFLLSFFIITRLKKNLRWYS